MARHVDIIRNEPLAGSSYVLARIVFRGARDAGDVSSLRPCLEMEKETHGPNREVMWGYLRSRVEIDPHRDPDAFLQALPGAIDSTYVVASPVHDDDECPYIHSMDPPPLSI